jgi:hypothetical protein
MIYKFLIIACVILFAGCAKIITPEGGPKDNTPPKIIHSSPKNLSTNVRPNAITLSFDEYVNVVNVAKNLIVSPPLKREPEVIKKKKTITFALLDSLRENTTYQFNFGECIVDLNEGNKLDSNIFVFSTREFLDSLSISGAIEDAYSGQKLADVTLMLHLAETDSAIYKQLPFFIARSNAKGQFKFKYLPNASFQLFAIKESNGNYLYDQAATEELAFSDILVKPDTSNKILLRLFKAKNEKQFLKSSKSLENGFIQLVYENEIKEPSIEIIKIPSQTKLINSLQLANDTILLWFKNFSEGDSVNFVVFDGKRALDTLFLPLKQPKVKAKNQIRPAFKSNFTLSNGIDLHDTLTLTFDMPIDFIYQDSMKLIINKNEIPFTIHQKSFNQFQIISNWKEDSTYLFFAYPGAFVSHFQQSNDTIKLQLKVKSNEYYGTFYLKIIPPENKQYVLEVNDEKNILKIRKRPIESNKMKFEKLYPGKYSLRLIEDDNENGIWDTGNYSLKKQPEKIYYYKEAVLIRSNWDTEVEWNINELPVKEKDKK